MLGNLITGLVLQAAAFASIFGLYFTLVPPSEQRSGWHFVILVVAIAAAILLLVREGVIYKRSAPKVYKDSKKINDYMYRWIGSGGRVVIFSRDMSWASGDEIRRLLFEKAENNELTICLEHSIPLTGELQNAGATIVYYEDYNHVPRSRFTIIDFEREGARVAVGVNEDGNHVIQEFRSGTHPIFAVCEDLAKFVINRNKS